ncbi:26S proteasome non-ATPase regulatory subunit 6 [Camellia lanceoleosa]|uniref:26S proteasome non-ATPase regulatory subunit 6 n=1 Tax=Camellia lanceoleosa TaxID=1840588 RepID=A0ACC0IDP8_9ERIC|nr:26S proteasome non-ATPase regulatory subunit 6 [Camellia lanceoleosa]
MKTRSEESKELNVFVERTERNPNQVRKAKSESQKLVGESDDGNERNLVQLSKVKSGSTKALDESVDTKAKLVSNKSLDDPNKNLDGLGDGTGGNSFELKVDPRFVWNRNILKELIENKIRGLIPLLWEQIVDLSYKPRLNIIDHEQTSKVVEHHFHDIIERYGETVAVDLTDKHGDEGQLSMAYATEMEKLPNVRIADAEENLGESEIREAHLAKSLFFIRIGDKALEQLKLTESKTVAVGQKMDLVFRTLQIGFFYMDFDLISKSIDKAKKKNRLKVYEGLYYMSTRNFKKANSLFLDSISTFTTYELFPYDNFIFYTVLTSIISLDRVSLKQKLMLLRSSQLLGKSRHLFGFLNSLYDCQYNWPDGANKIGPLFASPLPVYMREVRTVVYSQFLESYKSVTIEAMAKAFGVTVEFIDLELSRFIAAGKLHCKIDKVAGVLETNRPDAKNALYQATIKQGDFLLNRIQKLSRVIDL